MRNFNKCAMTTISNQIVEIKKSRVEITAHQAIHKDKKNSPVKNMRLV